MNKEIFTKLYNEATESSSDLMDKGRKELALELIRDNADFLARNYPNYYTCSRITLINDLSKIVFNETVEGEYAHDLLQEIGYSRAFSQLAEAEAEAYAVAAEAQLAMG
tara:strand:- start:800 stop:1126 length:327 start_codon:yes stop_codon:yes gene_type:complete